MLRKIISVLMMAVAVICISGCEKELVSATGTISQLNSYEGNYSILVNVESSDLGTDVVTIGLNSDMELTDSSGKAISAEEFVKGSKITFTYEKDTEMLICYPPILNGCKTVILE